MVNDRMKSLRNVNIYLLIINAAIKEELKLKAVVSKSS